jgi:hypothetical protein
MTSVGSFGIAPLNSVDDESGFRNEDSGASEMATPGKSDTATDQAWVARVPHQSVSKAMLEKVERAATRTEVSR